MWKLLKLKWVMKPGLIWSHLLCNVLKKLSDAPATWLHTSLRGFVFLRWEHCFFLSFLCFCNRNFCFCNVYIAWWCSKCINILLVDSQPFFVCLRFCAARHGDGLYDSYMRTDHIMNQDADVNGQSPSGLPPLPKHTVSPDFLFPRPSAQDFLGLIVHSILSVSPRWKCFSSARMNSSKEQVSLKI